MASASMILADSGPLGALPAVLGLLLLMAILVGLVQFVRKRYLSKDDEAYQASGGLTLGGLRDLVRQGKMTQEEYDQTKAQLVAASQRKAERDALEVKPVQRRAGGGGDFTGDDAVDGDDMPL